MVARDLMRRSIVGEVVEEALGAREGLGGRRRRAEGMSERGDRNGLA